MLAYPFLLWAGALHGTSYAAHFHVRIRKCAVEHRHKQILETFSEPKVGKVITRRQICGPSLHNRGMRQAQSETRLLLLLLLLLLQVRRTEHNASDDDTSKGRYVAEEAHVCQYLCHRLTNFILCGLGVVAL